MRGMESEEETAAELVARRDHELGFLKHELAWVCVHCIELQDVEEESVRVERLPRWLEEDVTVHGELLSDGP